jgi:hypothetical protein
VVVREEFAPHEALIEPAAGCRVEAGHRFVLRGPTVDLRGVLETDEPRKVGKARNIRDRRNADLAGRVREQPGERLERNKLTKLIEQRESQGPLVVDLFAQLRYRHARTLRPERERKPQLLGIHREGGRPYRSLMSTLHIEHPISDFETWASAFDQFSDARRDAGVRSHRVLRPLDNPCFVVVDLEFDTNEAALAFREFLRTVVWAVPENSPALGGEPHAVVLRAEPM